MDNLVIFDLWNTIIATNGPRFVDRIANLMTKLSSENVTSEDFQDYLRSTGCLHEEIEIEDIATEFWKFRFGKNPPLSLSTKCTQEHVAFVRSASFIGDSQLALNTLREAGIKVAVVSNATSATIEVLNELKIEDAVDKVWISCQSGFLKPDPRSFATAAKYFQISFSDCYVVGDKITTDILGARLCLMNSVLVDPSMDNTISDPNGSMIAITQTAYLASAYIIDHINAT